MVKMIMLIFLWASSFNSFAFKLAILVDNQSQQYAQTIIDTLNKTTPFNQFDFAIEVKNVNSKQLECRANPKLKRVPECNLNKIALLNMGMTNAADHSIVLTSEAPQGGANYGTLASIFATSDAYVKKNLSSMFIHELMHRFGFADEYPIDKAIAQESCETAMSQSLLNNAILTLYEPYASDASARTKHSANIPWYEKIRPTTLVTHQNATKLGTQGQGDKIGLYEGQMCANAQLKGKKVFQPGLGTTIMADLSAPIGIVHEKILLDILGKIPGLKRISGVKNTLPKNILIQHKQR